MRIHLSQTPRRLLTFAIILAMLACLLPAGTQEASAATTLRVPRTTGETVTWDCVWFGNYPQSKHKNGGYKIEPIKWRVLSVDGNEALLLADKNLDVKQYHSSECSVTWESSTVRKWLNEDGSDGFLKKAFSSAEQRAIYEKAIQNPSNPKHGTAGGSITKDKVFLLSFEEASNPEYGFPRDYSNKSKARVADNTDYAYAGNARWWLRSPGGRTDYTIDVSGRGAIDCNGAPAYVRNDVIRPALRLDLSSDSWSYAGTVSSDGKVDEQGEKPVYANHMNVQAPSQEDIRNFVKGAGKVEAVTYEKKPVTKAPCNPGGLSKITLDSALKQLNQIRYIAGIDADVTLNDSYNEMAQAAALLNCLNGTLSHYPRKPSGVSEELYKLGYKGSSSSNLGILSPANLLRVILFGWMEDSDPSNIDRVGHRRWILNPDMKQTGFGAVNDYYSVYAIDKSRESDYCNVAWPAQNTPTEFFGSEFAWSLSTGVIEDKKEIHVALTRTSDHKTWNFSNGKSDGAFFVDNGGYGQSGCIIFRPKDKPEYRNGDTYHVKITGLAQGTLDYDVSFFDLYELTIDPIPIQKYTDSKEICPKVTVRDQGKILKENVDYEVYVSDNIQPGTATVDIYGTGDYCGAMAVAHFKIKKNEKKRPVLKKPVITVKKLGAGNKQKVKISWKKVQGADGYAIEIYDAKTKKKRRLINYSSKALSFTDRSVKRKHTYKYRVRAFYETEDLDEVYGPYCAYKKIKIK